MGSASIHGSPIVNLRLFFFLFFFFFFFFFFRLYFLSASNYYTSFRRHLVFAQSWWMQILWSSANTGVSAEERRERVRSFFPNSAVYALSILLGWCVRWEVSSRTAVVFKGAESLWISQLTFTPSVFLNSKWCNHTIVLTRLQIERISFLFYQTNQILLWL